MNIQVNYKLKNILLFILFFTIVVFYRGYTVFYHFIDWDEASFMVEAWAMTKGQILYKDIYQIHPIFQFFVFIPLFKLLPTDLVPHFIKVIDLFIILFGALIFSKIIKNIFNDKSLNFLSSLLFIFYFGFFEWTHSVYGEYYSIFPIIFSFYFMITSNSNDEKKGLIIGFLWGIAFFFKQTAIFDIFSMLIYILFFNIKNINKKKFLNFSFYGFLCCFFIAMIYPFYNDSLKETFEAIFFKNIRNYTNLKIDFFSPLIFITSLFIKLFLKVQDYFNIMIQSLIPLTIFILPLILGSFKTFINFKDLKPAHKKILFFSIIWFITDIFGISLIGRNFSHYYIQLAPPFILVIISFISELSRALNKILFIIIFIVILINSISLFRLRIKDDNFLYPKKVKKSVEIAKYIKTHTPESSTMFIFKDYNIDIFFLSNRLSCNGIYMYVDMDSAHTKNKLAESYYRSKFLENLPQTLLTGPLGNILNSTSEPFFDAIIRKNYTLKKEMYGTKIYFLKSPTSFIE